MIHFRKLYYLMTLGLLFFGIAANVYFIFSLFVILKLSNHKKVKMSFCNKNNAQWHSCTRQSAIHTVSCQVVKLHVRLGYELRRSEVSSFKLVLKYILFILLAELMVKS